MSLSARVLCLFIVQVGIFQALSLYLRWYSVLPRVSVQGVKSLGGHFTCLCRGFDFYEVKK